MIVKSVLLECVPERAFRLFTEQAGSWWPETRRHTADPHSQIAMLESGRFFERAQDGREVELGRVRLWQPPHRVELDFYPGTDAQHPSDVTIRFEAEGAQTRVTVEHKPTPLSQELWNQRAGAFERSWQAVFDAAAAAAVRGT